jgi:hypothetical protein
VWVPVGSKTHKKTHKYNLKVEISSAKSEMSSGSNDYIHKWLSLPKKNNKKYFTIKQQVQSAIFKF